MGAGTILIAASLGVVVSAQPGLRAADRTEFPLTERAFLLGLGFHPAHKKDETPQDLQRALGQAMAMAGRHAVQVRER